MTAPDLSPAEAVKVAAFGLDAPEARPALRLASAIELLDLRPHTAERDAERLILSHTLARLQVRVARGGNEEAVWSAEADGIRLADAILERANREVTE